MKVDWKYFSTTPGYKSLKEAYIHNCKEAGKRERSMRDKAEFYRHFQWVIARCLHYASKQNRTPWDVLNEWELKRNYWWFSFYQDNNQPKIRSASISRVPMGARGIKKYYTTGFYADDIRSNNRVNCQVTRMLRNKRIKKARWTIEKKSRHKRLGC